MLTTWEYSVKTEAERLIQCAHQIGVGFYKTNNFLVLPFAPNNTYSQAVTFPDLNYSAISRFWEQVKKANVYDLPMDIDLELIGKVSNIIIENKINKPQFEKTKLLWEKSENEIISEIYKVLPDKKGLITKITIYPTVFGTGASFNFINKAGEIIIYLREDQGIHDITEVIITSLTRDDVYKKLDGVWAESEIIADFFVTQTSIAKVLQKYEKAELYLPTLKGIRGKEQVKLMHKSDEFYKKLGIPSFEKPFSFTNDTPQIFNKPVVNITETEKSLMLTLIKNQNQVVDFDSIGSSIFKSDDDFSLYAISKTIQRLRDKFEANGISGSYIQTLRGKGYLLKN